MKKYYYNSILNVSSKLLNICIRYRLWKFVKKITEFRKTYIVPTLRIEVIKRKQKIW